jgi:hypothetical protein
MGMGYKILGYIVWNGAQWYVSRRTRAMAPSRGTAAMAGLVVAGTAIAAVVAARRGDN